MFWKDLISRLKGKKSASGPVTSESVDPISRTLEQSIKGSPPPGAPKYSISGHLTQYPGVDENAQESLLVIGLDFGTAFTKVVIGGVTWWAVPFDSLIESGNRFLLPGVLSVDGLGRWHVGTKEECASPVTDLKMRLLQGDYSEASCVHVAAFLSHVLKHTRAWLLNEHKGIYQNQKLEWNVNVGLPTESYHDAKLIGVYHSIILSAWQVSVIDESITLDSVRDVYRNVLTSVREEIDFPDNGLHPDNIGLFPEFAAQVAGYVKSPLVRPDLHALIDIGAGTVDFTVFNIHLSDGEDKFPIFARDVKPLGAQYLVQHRFEKAGYRGSWKPAPHDAPLTTYEFSIRIGVSESELKNIDQEFIGKLSSQVMDCLRYTKKCRYPTSKNWVSGISIFFCGGGSKVDVYENFISRMEVSGSAFPISRMTLPRPNDLVAEHLDDDSFDRLSVAYGLARAFDMVEVIRQNEVEDFLNKDNKDNQNWIGKTCTKCGGTGGGYRNCANCGGKGFY